MVDYTALARLRPMMPAQAAHDIVEGKAYPSNPKLPGYVSLPIEIGFGARIDVHDRIGTLSFYKNFPAKLAVEGLHTGMSIDEAKRARPTLEHHAEPDCPPNFSGLTGPASDDNRLLLRFIDGKLVGFDLFRPGVEYPKAIQTKADPRLTKAYNLHRGPHQRLPDGHRDATWRGGWCFGLPPGVNPAQWPLSPLIGHPLRHAFTLYVPEQYRVKGLELVAVSIFVDDQIEEISEQPEIAAFMAEPVSATPPDKAGLLPFWHHLRGRHPHQFAMEDELGCHYAAIWLTQAEFDGPHCRPPHLRENSLLKGMEEPGWLSQMASEYYRPLLGGTIDWLEGATCLDAACPIMITGRIGDPNVGKPAREWDNENTESGYIRAFSDRGNELKVERFMTEGPTHLGGTMFPIQGYADFGPYTLEFAEEFAGFNFGGGTAQLDLELMKLDWACG